MQGWNLLRWIRVCRTDWGTHSGALATRWVYTLWEEECVILVYFCNCESALRCYIGLLKGSFKSYIFKLTYYYVAWYPKHGIVGGLVINNNITIMMDGCWWNNPNLHFDLMLWYENHINKKKKKQNGDILFHHGFKPTSEMVESLLYCEDLEKHDHVHLVWFVVFYANVPYAMN